MTRAMQPQDLIDSTVVDPEDNKIGKVGTVYYAENTREAAWVTVKTGLFGQKESFVPLQGSRYDDRGLHVAVGKDKVAHAPQMDTDGHLSQSDSAELYRYYDMGTGATGTGTQGRHGAQDRTGEQPGTGTRTGNLDDRSRTGEPEGKHAAGDQESMTRSEERLKVGTEERESGHVRLRKYVVTEEQQVTVPVSHEEVRIEREPITDADASARRDARIDEEEQDVVLHEERPVVDKESVPVERVRMGTERVTEEETVSGEVRKEQIDVDDETRRGRSS